jgi:CheY-like chemotaxis protein
VLPLRVDPALAATPAEVEPMVPVRPIAKPARAAKAEPPAPPDLPLAEPVPDDRDSVATDARLILAIEDDPAFATILRDLVRERGFRCLVALTGTDGLALAMRYAPNAILLDVVLPDLSGMAVLEQLKRDPRTRHIPVHMVSNSDFSREARELGAVGYALKPVEREQLVQALRTLESQFAKQDRRVLVVEDDARQRASLVALLETDETGIHAVATATEALAALGDSTYDCMVLDLNLPDLTGYQLLERMAGREDVAFPPVIVYTGRSLSREEEQKLLRFSDSIILKGARSPERLLDEVTLFLHQVESRLPAEKQRMLQQVRDRDELLDGRRILVVEDDVRNVFALTSLLEPRGVDLTVARNGLEALAALERQPADAPFDLVLMDIMMPEMDGLTAMREIRKRPHWHRVPIIALTAKAMKDDREQCMAAGANDYIAKPLDVDRLLSLVRVWLPRQARR